LTQANKTAKRLKKNKNAKNPIIALINHHEIRSATEPMHEKKNKKKNIASSSILIPPKINSYYII